MCDKNITIENMVSCGELIDYLLHILWQQERRRKINAYYDNVVFVSFPPCGCGMQPVIDAESLTARCPSCNMAWDFEKLRETGEYIRTKGLLWLTQKQKT